MYYLNVKIRKDENGIRVYTSAMIESRSFSMWNDFKSFSNLDMASALQFIAECQNRIDKMNKESEE